MKFLLAVLLTLPVLAQTEQERYDKEAVDSYKMWMTAAASWIPLKGEWTDDATCGFVSAYESLAPLERYAAKRSGALESQGITVDSVRKLRMRFADPLISNLRDRVKNKKPILRGECGIADPDEIGGLLKVDAGVLLRGVPDVEKYLLAITTTPASLDPKAMAITLPEEINLEKSEANDAVVLFGSRTEAGSFIMEVRWKAGNTSRPHTHPRDRHIVVLEGTCYMGTGEKYDPDNMVPFKKGTYLVHKANQSHYDGAKEEDCVMWITGEGPIGVPPQIGPPK